jgi:orotate phosphoribosyltransferase-like protein
VRKIGARIPLRERADLAKRAHELNERGMMTWEIALRLSVSEPTAKNLIGYGRRLAAGQPEQLEWR